MGRLKDRSLFLPDSLTHSFRPVWTDFFLLSPAEILPFFGEEKEEEEEEQESGWWSLLLKRRLCFLGCPKMEKEEEEL